DTQGVMGAQATSGASGNSATLGVAGSVAIDLVTISTPPRDPGTASLSGTAADVSMTAALDTTDYARGLSGGVSGAKFGIGASLGLSIVNITTDAGVADANTLGGARHIVLSASTKDATDTQAEN